MLNTIKMTEAILTLRSNPACSFVYNEKRPEDDERIAFLLSEKLFKNLVKTGRMKIEMTTPAICDGTKLIA